jgi:hypothetical protein
VVTGGKKKKRTSKKNVDGRCTSSHENKTFRSRSVVKQKGMVFGCRKTATAVTRSDRKIDILKIHPIKWYYEFSLHSIKHHDKTKYRNIDTIQR